MRPAHRSAVRPQAPGEDTAFMEQILRELSAQNEHARSERTSPRPAAGAPPTTQEAVASGSSAAPHAPLVASSALRSPTIRVARDGGFRTDEGTPSARAYLPSRTLSPGRTTPHETATVHVSDPRRLPTLRVPRDRDSSAPSAPQRASAPPPEEVVPTLRSAPGQRSREASSSAVRWWLGGVMLVAVAGAIAVTLAVRFWSVPSTASGAAAGSALPASHAPSSGPAVGIHKPGP
jgi:hypothetical protein